MKKKKYPIPPEERKVPLGEPLPLTDEDLDRLSQVTPEDIEIVKVTIKKSTPRLAALLETKPVKKKKSGRKP